MQEMSKAVPGWDMIALALPRLLLPDDCFQWIVRMARDLDLPGAILGWIDILDVFIVVDHIFRLTLTDSQPQDLESVERNHILSVYFRTGRNVKRTAEILGVNRTTVYNKLKRYGFK